MFISVYSHGEGCLSACLSHSRKKLITFFDNITDLIPESNFTYPLLKLAVLNFIVGKDVTMDCIAFYACRYSWFLHWAWLSLCLWKNLQWSVSSGLLKGLKLLWMGNSLAVQWLGLCAFTAEGTGSIPGWGTKMPQAAQCGQKKKKKGYFEWISNWLKLL